MALLKSTGSKKVNLDFNKEFINTFSVYPIICSNDLFVNLFLTFVITDFLLKSIHI